MPKPPLLGNDPFQRGAAPRPATPPAPAQPAEPAAEATPPPAPPAEAKAEPKPERRARAPKAPRKTKPPAAGPRRKQAKPNAAPKKRSAAPRPAPALHVIEGELIEEPPPPISPPLLPETTSTGPRAEPARREDAGAGVAGLIERAGRRALALVEQAIGAALASPLAQRAQESLAEMPLAVKLFGTVNRAATAAMPAYQVAAKMLPPAYSAARSALSAIASGEAARDLVTVAAEAGDTARKIALRVEPATHEVDDFGEDPSRLSRLEPLFDFLHERYFRVEVQGIANLPPGPCLVVCNHAGALPIDGPMIRTVLRRDAHRPDARWLVEDAIFHAPFLGTWLNRLGAVRACPENAERLLAQGAPVAVFPEGLLGMSKTVRRRYVLQRFGRGGFVKLAMRSGVPIVPAAIVGAEDASPLLAKLPFKSLGVPFIPITPTFPLLGPAGLVPLPSKWVVSFLPPVTPAAEGPQAAEDLALVARYTNAVREALQAELDRLVAARSSMFG